MAHSRLPKEFREAFDFTEFTIIQNSNYFKEYMEYLFFISVSSNSYINSCYYYIRDFLRYAEKEGHTITDIPSTEVRKYFFGISEDGIKEDTYNKKVRAIELFYKYLYVKGWISNIPMDFEHYLKRNYPYHKKIDSVQKKYQSL